MIGWVLSDDNDARLQRRSFTDNTGGAVYNNGDGQQIGIVGRCVVDSDDYTKGYTCETCGDNFNEDQMITLDHCIICTDCCDQTYTYVESRGEYVDNDDVVSVGYEPEHIDDCVCLLDGDYCLTDDAQELYDGEWGLAEDCVELHNGEHALVDDVRLVSLVDDEYGITA